ncbi:MAG: ACP S-malonyltransferase [Lachnospiraceae bacterium]|nr:ACP S-malonyltransferase [Lachnospiraceae bacterium]
MKIGFVYAGQGSQCVGMGQDFYNEYALFRESLDSASNALKDELGLDIRDLCFNGPIEKLSLTAYTQPAMVAFAVGVTKVLAAEGIAPEYALGLSLGEYSALYAAGVLSEEDVVRLVAKRGKFMTQAAEGLKVGMSAVIGPLRGIIEECCGEVSSETGKIVSPANYNCPGQIVISGDLEAVEKASAKLKEAGAKRVLPLNVSGPFHTALMKPAGDLLAKEMESYNFGPEKIKVVYNAIGRAKNDGETVQELLEKQVQSSVYLEDSIRYMQQQGVDTFVEIGPGKVISGFIKKTLTDVTSFNIDNVENLKTVVEALR